MPAPQLPPEPRAPARAASRALGLAPLVLWLAMVALLAAERAAAHDAATALPPARDAAAALPGPVCQDLASSTDVDIRRHLALFAGMEVAYCWQRFTDQGVPWLLQSFRRLDRPQGPAMFLPHDDEDAAFAAAVMALRQWGGAFLTVSARAEGGACQAPGEGRCNCGIDPNRNFAATATRPDSCANTGGCGPIRRGAPRYTAAVRGFFEAQPFWQERRVVIALHNNADGFHGDGWGGDGDFSILMDGDGLFYAGVPFPGALNDEDNVLLTAGLSAWQDNPLAQALVAHFNDLGINVHYEHVQQSDCSLSNVAMLDGWADLYFNVETEHGNLAHQMVILEALMAVLDVPNVAVDQMALGNPGSGDPGR